MPHAVEVPMEPFLTQSGSLRIHQVPAWSDNLIWLLECTATSEVAAVDGPEAGPVLDYCRAHGLGWKTILNTHIHGDHIGINRDMDKRDKLAGMRVVGASKTAGQIPGLTEAVEDGDELVFGQVTGQVLLTEGHLNGHISYVFDDVVFCGDTLFTGGCGRLFDGPPEKMHSSLQTLAALAPKTRVCCAHEYTQDNLRFAYSVDRDNEALRQRIRSVWKLRGEGRSAVPSTIAEERATNPFLRLDAPSVRSAAMEAFPDRSLDSGAEALAAVRELKDTKRYQRLGDDDMPL